MSSPGPRPLVMRWTAEQFQQMGDMGWFEGRRPVLLDGVIWEQGMMDPPHAVALELLAEALRPVFRPGCMVRQQMPLNVDEYTDPVPDVAVVPGAPRDYSDAHPVTAVLVAEVSDNTVEFDLTEKVERYATAGVGDYWVLDLENRRLLVLRDPQPLPKGLGATAYRTHLTLGPADRVCPLAAPNASVTVSDLLP